MIFLLLINSFYLTLLSNALILQLKLFNLLHVFLNELNATKFQLFNHYFNTFYILKELIDLLRGTILKYELF